MPKNKTKQETDTKKHPKPRTNKYEEKLKINGTFNELLKELATPKEPIKKTI